MVKEMVIPKINIDTVRNYAIALVMLAVIIIPLIYINTVNCYYLIPKIMVLFIIASILLLLYNFNQKERKRSILHILIGLFLVSLGISTLFSVSILNSIFGDYQRFQGFCFYLFSIAFFYIGSWLSEFKKIVLITSVVTGGIIGSITIFEFWHGAVRVIGTLGHPINLANYLLLVIPLSLGLLASKEKRINIIFYYISLFFMNIGLILSFSRAGWVGILLLHFIFIISLGKNIFTIRKMVVGVTITLLFSLVTSIILVQYQPKHISLQSGRINEMNKIDSRPLIWRGALELFLHKPYGCGLSMFDTSVAKYLPNGITDDFETSVMDKPHNDFFDILSSQGILGGILFLTIIIYISIGWFKWRRNKSRDITISGLWASVLVHLFVIQFSFVEVSYTFLFWLFLGFLTYDNFPKTEKFKFNITNPLIKKILSVMLIVFAISYSSLIYLADSNYCKWLKFKDTSNYLKYDSYINKAITLAPWESQYRFHRASEIQMTVYKGKYSQAEQLRLITFLAKETQLLLKKYPFDYHAISLAAETLVILKKYDGALNLYQDALSYFPNNYYFVTRMGEIYAAIGKYTNAKNCYLKALRMRSWYTRAIEKLQYLEKNRLK